MGAAAPLIGPALGLVTSLIGQGGGRDDPPEPPAPIPPPEPPPPPPAPKGVTPEEVASEEAERARSLKRRRIQTPGLLSLDRPSTGQKTLLGE